MAHENSRFIELKDGDLPVRTLLSLPEGAPLFDISCLQPSQFWPWKVNEDVRLVLAEITRVQKALQLDYLPPTRGLRSGAGCGKKWVKNRWKNMRQDMEKLWIAIVIS